MRKAHPRIQAGRRKFADSVAKARAGANRRRRFAEAGEDLVVVEVRGPGMDDRVVKVFQDMLQSMQVKPPKRARKKAGSANTLGNN
jgi:hypothetical protein